MNKKRLNLEQFIKKAKEFDAKKEKLFLLDTDAYGEVEFRRPTTKEILNYMDGNGNAFVRNSEGDVISQNSEEILDASKELVYQCCSFLQSKELRESLDIENPLDTPVKVFGIAETNELASKLFDKVHGKKSVKEITEEIKN